MDGKPDYVDELGGLDFLPQMLPQVDFLVLCLASVPSTSGIIGEKELRSMKKTAYLINFTGGKAIDERLIARALKEHWIAGAAAQKWDLVLPIFSDNLRRFLAGESLRNVVDKGRGY